MQHDHDRDRSTIIAAPLERRGYGRQFAQRLLDHALDRGAAWSARSVAVLALENQLLSRAGRCGDARGRAVAGAPRIHAARRALSACGVSSTGSTLMLRIETSLRFGPSRSCSSTSRPIDRKSV